MSAGLCSLRRWYGDSISLPNPASRVHPHSLVLGPYPPSWSAASSDHCLSLSDLFVCPHTSFPHSDTPFSKDQPDNVEGGTHPKVPNLITSTCKVPFPQEGNIVTDSRAWDVDTSGGGSSVYRTPCNGTSLTPSVLPVLSSVDCELPCSTKELPKHCAKIFDQTSAWSPPTLDCVPKDDPSPYAESLLKKIQGFQISKCTLFQSTSPVFSNPPLTVFSISYFYLSFYSYFCSPLFTSP